MPANLPLSTIKYFISDSAFVKPAFEDLTRAYCVTGLGGQRRTRHVRRHAIMRHGPPGMIWGRWLGKPDITGVACQTGGLERTRDRVLVADISARAVHKI